MKSGLNEIQSSLSQCYSPKSLTLNCAKSIREIDMQYVWLIPLDSLKCHFVISTLSHLQLALQLQQRTHCIVCVKYSREHFLCGGRNLSSRQHSKDINIESYFICGRTYRTGQSKERGKYNFSLMYHTFWQNLILPSCSLFPQPILTLYLC